MNLSARLVLAAAFLVPSAGTLVASLMRDGPHKVEILVTGEVEGDATAAGCLLRLRMSNNGPARISSFLAEVAATDARNGQALPLPFSTVVFAGVETRASADWNHAAVAGVHCDDVRLEVLRTTCSPPCGRVHWMRAGLAGVSVGGS